MKGRSPLLPIFLIVLVDVFGLTLVIPLLGIYAEHFGATPFQATLLVSTYAVCQLFSGPVLGSLSDRYGRKPVLLVSQIGTCFGFLLMARADALWITPRLSRVIDGLTAGNLTTAQAYISDNTAPENRSKSFALIGIAFGVGFFLGPAVTGSSPGTASRPPIYLAAALSFHEHSVHDVPSSGRRSAESSPSGARGSRRGARRAPDLAVRDRDVHPILRAPSSAGLFLQFFCFIFAFSTFTSNFALFAERRFRWHDHPFRPARDRLSIRMRVGFHSGSSIQGGSWGAS